MLTFSARVVWSLSVFIATCALTNCSKTSVAPAPDSAVVSKAPTLTDAAASDSTATETRSLVEARESVYNNVYVYRTGTNLSMTFGDNRKLYTESIFNTADDRDLPVPYTRFMTTTLMYPAKISSILEIGSGGGRVAWYLHRFLPEVQITTVELDPTVADLSRKYFGLREEPHFRQITRDGRMFLADSKEKYDVILMDAYRGPFVPFHMLTKEFYSLVRDHLAEGGVMAQNVDPSTMLFDADVNTLHEVFSQIEFYDASGTNTGGNVVVIAYNGDGHSLKELNERADKIQTQFALRYDERQMLWHRFALKPVLVGQKVTFDVVDQSGRSTAGIDENAKVLTDDFAPVDSLKAIENHNHRWETVSR